LPRAGSSVHFRRPPTGVSTFCPKTPL